jgi:cytochrome c oxidase assembly protein Cox11
MILRRSRLWIAIGVIVLAVLALASWLVWRFTGPVEVRPAATVEELPFEVEMIPPVVWARPGEVISVTYRIRNTSPLPLEALGRVDVEPSSASGQVKIFLTQCTGLNAFQATVPMDYQVVFRVQPAGLFGSSRVVIRHTFTRANLR